jgi:hypothetical protein
MLLETTFMEIQPVLRTVIVARAVMSFTTTTAAKKEINLRK